MDNDDGDAPMGTQPTNETPTSDQAIRPDLPRWVSSRLVDSEAMLSAFMKYQMECTTEEKMAVAELYAIDHAMQETIVVNGKVLRPQRMEGPVPRIPCVDRNCERCSTGRGGYKFRWYSEKWSQHYTELAKKRRRLTGTPIWFPGEPETDP